MTTQGQAEPVYLVRHGQSTWNAQGRLQGQTAHPPLTERGVQQMQVAAQELVRLLGGRRVPVVWSSDLCRARQSADIVAAALGCGVQEDPRLREQANGHMEGKLGSELVVEDVPPGQHITEVRWGGGESIRDVYLRLAEFFADLPADGPHVILTHGNAIGVARALLAGRGHRETSWDDMPNAQIHRAYVMR